MATSLHSILESMQEKISALTLSISDLRDANRHLEEENEELRRRLALADTELQKARTDSEFLAISHRLADNPDTIVDARRLIAGLIRNIDRCIDMMKE